MDRRLRVGTMVVALSWTLCGAPPPDSLKAALAFMRAEAPPERCTSDRRPKPDSVCALYRDATAVAGERRRNDDGAEIWMRRLKGGEFVFALINNGKRAEVIDVIWKEHGLKGSPRVWDAFSGESRGKVHGGFGERVEPGGASLLRVKQ